MKHELLSWDSTFFKIPIGRLVVENSDSPEAIRNFLRRSDQSLTYVFTAENPPEEINVELRALGAQLLDIKTVYRKSGNLMASGENADDIRSIRHPAPEILELALKSGWRSRFFMDLRLRPHFAALYSQWVLNCLGKPQAGVWACFRHEIPVGMACATVGPGEVGKLGLIAVDERFRGAGLGKLLLGTVENFYLQQGAATAEIVTQQDNYGACGLYEQCGYQVVQRIPTWHYWKSNN